MKFGPTILAVLMVISVLVTAVPVVVLVIAQGVWVHEFLVDKLSIGGLSEHAHSSDCVASTFMMEVFFIVVIGLVFLAIYKTWILAYEWACEKWR